MLSPFSEDATIEEAALLMYNHKIGGLVVVDKIETVVGVITETDIFKCFVDVMGCRPAKHITAKLNENRWACCADYRVMAEMNINIDSMN